MSFRETRSCCISDKASHAIAALRSVEEVANHRLHWQRRVVAVGIAFAACHAASATDLDLEVGRSYMDCASTPTVFVEVVPGEHRIGATQFVWSPDASLGWIDGRDAGRYRYSAYSTTSSIWLVAGGVRIRTGDDAAWYRPLFFSFQPALHTGRTQALSSAYEFVSTLGWQGRHFNFQIRHISNGSLHEPNRGETMALIGVTFNI